MRFNSLPCPSWTTTTILSLLVAITSSSSRAFHVSDQVQEHLLAHSHGPLVETTSESETDRFLADNNNNYNFLPNYSVKFQGCHSISQWNENVDDQNDVRVMTKYLVRYRLCPEDTCVDERSAGCSSSYGDYVVDMDTFLQSYFQGMQDMQEVLCEEAQEDCQNQCNNNDDEENCMEQCYDAYDLSACYNNENAFDPQQYLQCAQINMQQNNNNNGGRSLEDQQANNNYNVQYYVGPYCANQGGEIRLGVFTDDTCTTFSSSGENKYYNTYRQALPYSEESLVTNRCLSCGMADNDNDGNYEALEMCQDLYQMSGKCESKMDIDYQNEASCSYIEGIKIIREDGVIRTSTTRKSKAAAVVIGLFMTLSVLLGAYVYYLRTKLSRAQINLGGM